MIRMIIREKRERERSERTCHLEKKGEERKKEREREGDKNSERT